MFERPSLPIKQVLLTQNLVQGVYVNVGKLASSAITGVATRQANAMVAKQRNTVQQHITASPRGYEVKQAADFVRIRELFTSGTTSETGQTRHFDRAPTTSDLPR
jgi:CRISPR/Cas system CMR subunit Cmr6 (Cas7 group RAMP superfamily)